MNYELKYTIFKTKWGWFGLAGTEKGLLRTVLPLAERQKVESHLLSSIEYPASRIKFDKNLFNTFQQQLIAYFNGTYVVFNKNIPIVLACPERSRGNGLSRFTVSVLRRCRNVTYGRTISYADLAKKAGFPKAARAIGGALAKNPLPLIIPCHRVVRSDGKIGGFTAPGGITLKKRLLQLEQRILLPA